MIITRIIWMLEMLMKVNINCNVALTFSNCLKCIKWFLKFILHLVYMHAKYNYVLFCRLRRFDKRRSRSYIGNLRTNYLYWKFCCRTFAVDFPTFTQSIAKFRIGVLLLRSGNEIMRWTYICIFRWSRPLWSPRGNTLYYQ